MSTTPIAEQRKPPQAVLICAACGKVFYYRESYITIPVPGGQSLTYSPRCYRGGETHGVATIVPPAPLIPSFVTADDKVQVYLVDGDIPEEMQHDKKRNAHEDAE